MFSATTSPSYSPTWVSGQMPLTSPIAQRRSPARRCSSTPIPCGLASTPTVSRPIPSTRGRRPVATSSRSPRSSGPPSKARTYSSPSRRAAVACWPSTSSIPSRRSASLSAWPSGAGSRGKYPVGAFDDDRLAAETPHDLGQLDARRPTAQHQQAARDSLHARRLAGAPDAFELTQSRDRRHERSCAGRHHNVLRGMAGAVDVDHAGAGQLARAPQQVDAPVGQPALLAGVGPVRDHVVPPGQRGRHVNLRGGCRVARARHRLARAQQRLRRDTSPVGALTADQFPLHDGDVQPAQSQRRGAVLARRPAAKNDHVIVTARAHRQPPSVAGDITAPGPPRGIRPGPVCTQGGALTVRRRCA